MKKEDKEKLEKYLQDPKLGADWLAQLQQTYVEALYQSPEAPCGAEARVETPAQNVHTPDFLCASMVGKLREFVELKGKNILTLNVEYVKVLGNENEITFLSDCAKKSRYIRMFYPWVKVVEEDFLKWEPNMKFDCVIGNPPYQKDAKNKGTGHTLWDKFAGKSLTLLKTNGMLAIIHPAGWRGCGDSYESVSAAIKDKQIEYLEIHDEQDGLKTFGVTTRYDWYILKNSSVSHNTVIFDQNGTVQDVDLNGIRFIPNHLIKKIYSLLAKDGEPKVEILYNRSSYGADKSWVSKDKSGKFLYPIVYSTPVEAPTILYSSTKDNGHFGISKLILNPCRPIGFVIDDKGKYGMSQWCVGIVGDRKYLDMVSEVIKNQKTNGFAEVMEACHFTDKIFNKDVISLFRREFWNEFCPAKN